MPPARRQDRAAYPQTDRCRYVDQAGNHCRRVATVGGFCRSCAARLELDIEEGGAADRLVGLFDRALARGYRNQLLVEAAAFLGGAMAGRIMQRVPPELHGDLRRYGRMMAEEAAARARVRVQQQAQRPPPPRQRYQQRPPPPPPPPPPRVDPMREKLVLARATLGFDADEKITVEAVKDRKRNLARIYHPDVGGSGSTTAMQKVNAAADLLLKHLGAKK